MNEKVLALKAWHRQALDRGIAQKELPSPHKLGRFIDSIETSAGEAKWRADASFAPWVDSLKRVLFAVNSGAFKGTTPLPDAFFSRSEVTASVEPEQPATAEEESTPAAGAVPAATERRSPTRRPAAEQTQPGAILDIRLEEFEPFDPFVDEKQLNGQLRIEELDSSTGEDGAADEDEQPVARRKLTWKEPEDTQAAVRIYRVYAVENDMGIEQVPPRREEQPRVVTSATTWIDDAPMPTAIRTYHVWVNEGATKEEALRAQPRLLELKSYVQPIRDVEIDYVDRVIRGHWQELPKTSKVEVQVYDVVNGPYDVVSDEKNIRGFDFEVKETGREYSFRFRRRVNDHASAYSEAYSCEVPAELSSVGLDVKKDGDGFRVAWKRPGTGEVRLYRTRDVVDAQALTEPKDLDVLSNVGLTDSSWINSNASSDETEFTVAWPDEWYSMSITSVNVVGSSGLVGETKSWVRCGTPKDVTLYERVEEQVLTFQWPIEATTVAVYTAPKDLLGGIDFVEDGKYVVDNNQVHHIRSISKSDYERDGGLKVSLPEQHVVILRPYRTLKGEQVFGKPAKLFYRGINKIKYHIAEEKLFDDRDEPVLTLEAKTLVGQNENLAFALCAEEGRFPLVIDENDDKKESDSKKRRQQQVELWRVAENGKLEESSPLISLSNSDINSEEDQPRCVARYVIDRSSLQRSTRESTFLRLFLRGEPSEGSPLPVVLDPAPSELCLPALVEQPRAPQPAQAQPVEPEEKEEKRGFFGRIFGRK